MKTLEDAQYDGRKILFYVDYNVAIDGGEIQSTYKIDKTLESLQYLIGKNPKLIVISSHLGRPKNTDDYSTKPIFLYLKQRLAELKPLEYLKIKDFLSAEFVYEGLFFTDNIRYYNEYEIEDFIKGFDAVVNDAFGCSHRKMPCKSYAGFLMKNELQSLSLAKKSDLLIIGGCKISDKLSISEKFNCKIFMAGCLGISVYKFMGYEVGGGSLCEDMDCSWIIQRINNGQIMLPTDFRVKDQNNEYAVKHISSIQIGDSIVDIGPESVGALVKLIKESDIICWNGPLGKFEDSHACATLELVEILSKKGKKVIVGGGETITAVMQTTSPDNFFHVSTGGGAMLSFLCGHRMPGLESLLE